MIHAVERPDWLKFKGYLHITPQIDIDKNWKRLQKKIEDSNWVARYAFYPLIHTTLKERRYKRLSQDSSKRSFSFKDEAGNYQRNIKERPLHYATHVDALIFSYYAKELQQKYEEQIASSIGLSDCIIAYRKILWGVEGKHKSTIHFAHEIFEEIKKRATINDECVVLTFDIKSFFSSLDHSFLKKAWTKVLGVETLPADHYNVFKAATCFSYIYLDELRIQKNKGFDEKELARIRNNFGVNAFFESPKAFREQVKTGKIKIYKFPFRNSVTKAPIGIPQGLPISAVLANIYLHSFDTKILNTVMATYGGYYRRYSDDIVVVCNKEDAEFIEAFIYAGIEESKVIISKTKTEKFIFQKITFGNKEPRLGSRLNYLGFEFDGQKPLIKSANLSKFYRRMISSVKSKARRAEKLSDQNPFSKKAVFRSQLYRLYTTKPLSNTKIHTRYKKLVLNRYGKYTLVSHKKTKVMRSNFLSYIDRASEIMQEPAIKNQIRKHKAIFNQSIKRYLE